MSQVAPAKVKEVVREAPIMEWEGYGTNGTMLAVAGEAPVRYNKLEPGIYEIYATMRGYGVTPLRIINDKLLQLPNPHADKVLGSVKKFWASRERYIKYGQLYKRGIMMHGAPGSGKTVTLTFLSQELVKAGGVVIYGTHPAQTTNVLKVIREREPERPLICNFEDLDVLIGNYGDQYFISLLDGEHKIDNVVFIATTNYLQKIDKRIRCRPSRFDEVTEIPMPERVTREAYLKHLLSIENLDKMELADWVDKTDGMSMAHLKELVIGVKVLGNPFEETLKRLKELGADLLKDTNDDDEILDEDEVS